MGNPGIDNAILVTIFNIVEGQSSFFMNSHFFKFFLVIVHLPNLIAATVFKL